MLEEFKSMSSCEQVLVSGYAPNSDHKIIKSVKVKNVSECSDRCCSDRRCGIFSYQEGDGTCTLFKFPDQLIYLPFPNTKNMVRTENNLVTGILMKRKIETWMPWIVFLAIVIFVLSMYLYKR